MPAPVLLSDPVPEIVPPSVAVVPVEGETAALPVSDTARMEVIEAVVASVPLPMVSVPLVSPNAPSDAICNVPAVMKVPPVWSLSPRSRSVPVPACVSVPVPDMKANVV